MNRHQSNPFLSDWDDNITNPTQADPHIFDTVSTLANDDDPSQARRSSCGQAEHGSNSSNRPSLYRRNMSSFEAASLQLEQHQQQMLENGGATFDVQKDLIAKMTADFQSAIQTNDKQFDASSFNPFDPFETIVDDDTGLNSPAPANQSERVGKFDLEPTQEDDIDRMESSNQNTHNSGRITHESIDDDEDELVSTPVRNIKSSLNSDLRKQDQYLDTMVDSASGEFKQVGEHYESDSITKAALFASLLAEAENNGQQADLALSGNASDDQNGSPNNVEAATHVIKGSPNSAGDGNDRPVSFFDPFETVIDKDALTSLVSDSHQHQENDAHANATANQDRTNPEKLTSGHNARSAGVVESASIETVIENSSLSKNSIPVEENSYVGNNKDTLDESHYRSATEISDAANSSQYPQTSIALGRPSGRRVEPLSGIAPPQPTPAKRASKQKQKVSNREDSSDSSEDDDVIQIVIRAQGADKNENKNQPTIVPLLPPPPSKSSMKQARERGQVDDVPSPIMGYKNRQEQQDDSDNEDVRMGQTTEAKTSDTGTNAIKEIIEASTAEEEFDENEYRGDQFVIPMTHSDDDSDAYGKPETPLYDEDTSYVLEDYPQKYNGQGWEMMLRYPPKKKLTANRFWKKIFVKLAQVPLAPDSKSKPNENETPHMCWALQIFDHQEDKKPMQEIPIQATYTVSEISSQLFDQFGKIFTIKLQYIFYKERVGVRQGQLARFIHTGHIGSSTTSGGHGVDPISIGAIKRMGAPIEHSPQISQIIKLGCINYEDIKQFKEVLEDCLFGMPIHRDRALTTYKTEEVQMAVRDETYVEVNQIGTITKQLARVRLFFLSFLNGMPVVEVGINDFHRQGKEVVGRMDILPVMTEEWIRLESWELHSTVAKDEFENPDLRIIKLTPPDATFFELMRFRIRPPRNRELPLQISANMTVTRTKVSINCEVMVPGCISRKHGQIPCENIAIKIHIPECWIYFFREEKHFRMGSKKSVNRRPGKVKGIERFLGGSGLQDFHDDSSLIEVTSGQAKYEHLNHAVVWRAVRWPKETQSAYVQNTMKIRLPLTAYDKMPESFSEYVHVEYTMPATTVSHTTLRSISVNPCDDEPPEKYVKYAAKFEYKVKMRLSINLGGRAAESEPEASPIIIMKQADLPDDLEREEDGDDDNDEDDDEDLEITGSRVKHEVS